MPPRHALPVLLLAVSALPARAADCHGLDYSATTPARLEQVVAAAPRTHFVKSASEAAGCPAATPACRHKAYLVPGDVVLSTRALGNHVCATYVGKSGQLTSGWLPADALQRKPVAPPTAADWVGQWSNLWGDSELQIELLDGGELRIRGDASWGGDDPERVERGAVHVGGLEPTTVRPDPAGFTLAEQVGRIEASAIDGHEGCAISLQRVGEVLLAADNLQCGGMNVTFSGIYRRQ